MSSVRRIILVVAALTVTLSANVLASECATCKGSWKAGGGAFVTMRTGELYDNGPDWKDWSMTITPSLERFVIGGTAFGGEFIYSRDYTGTEASNLSVTVLGIMPVVSQYFNLGGKEREESSTFFFVKFGAGIAKYWFEEEYSGFWGNYTNDDSRHSFFLGGEIGLMPMLSRSIGLEVGAHVEHEFLKFGESTIDGTIIQIGAGIAMFAL